VTAAARFVTPEEVEAAFYQAFQDLDLALMDQVWMEDPETFCVHPGGDLLRAKSAVLQSWSEIFTSAHRPTLVYQTLQTSGNGDLAIHLVEELIRPGGEPDTTPTRVVATNVYRRGRTGWQMISHHASLPVMDPRRRQRSGRLH
jgi:hypothetical protein